MKTTITCNICGEKFVGEHFSDVESKLQSHLEQHSREVQADTNRSGESDD